MTTMTTSDDGVDQQSRSEAEWWRNRTRRLISPKFNHDFQERAVDLDKQCSRCGLFEYDLPEKDRFCPFCPDCNNDEAVACETCHPGITAQIKARDEALRAQLSAARAEDNGLREAIRTEERKSRRIQIHVTHNNEAQTYHRVPDGQGWRVDAGRGTIIIGKGPGRVEVPLCNVLYFSPKEIS